MSKKTKEADPEITAITFTTAFSTRRQRAVTRYTKGGNEWRGYQATLEGESVYLLDTVGVVHRTTAVRSQVLYEIPKSHCIIEYEIPMEQAQVEQDAA